MVCVSPLSLENVNPLAPTFGLEFCGKQLCTIVEQNLQDLYSILIRNKLLIFREQDTSPQQLMFISNRLGQVQRYPFSNGIKGYPEIVEIRKEPEQDEVFSGFWHIDSTYLDTPPDFTLLAAKKVPTVGGDTVFSDSQNAFSALSEGMQKFLLSQKAKFVSNKFSESKKRNRFLSNSKIKNVEEEALYAIHQAVKIHEKTSIPSIYINHEHTIRFCSMTNEESAPILDYVFKHIAKDEFTARVRWKSGTISIWDNRSLQHHAVNDYPCIRRIMHHITINSKKFL